MSYKKGKRTVKKLASADPRLGLLVDEVLKTFDIGVYESDRSDARQYQMFINDRSQLDGITRRSKHQVTKKNPLSKAIDVLVFL